MATESDSRSAAEAAGRGREDSTASSVIRQAVTIVNDELVEMSLGARAEELERLAETLEAQAAKKAR